MYIPFVNCFTSVCMHARAKNMSVCKSTIGHPTTPCPQDVVTASPCVEALHTSWRHRTRLAIGRNRASWASSTARVASPTPYASGDREGCGGEGEGGIGVGWG